MPWEVVGKLVEEPAALGSEKEPSGPEGQQVQRPWGRNKERRNTWNTACDSSPSQKATKTPLKDFTEIQPGGWREQELRQ